MTELVDVFESGLFSVIIMLSGYVFTLILLKRNKIKMTSSPDIFLLSLALGSFMIVFSGILVGITTSLLVPFYLFFTLFLCLTLTIVLVTHMRKRTIFAMPRLIAKNVSMLKILAFASFCIYAFKLLAVLAIRPINDGDALYFWIPTAKMFFSESSIPVIDPFHFWTFTAEPGVSLLYAWAYSLTGDIGKEVFRLLPVPFFLSYPLLVCRLTFDLFKNEKAALVSMILASFIPATDLMLYFYAYYPDIFAGALVVTAVHFTLKLIDGESNVREWMIGVPLAVSLSFKYWYGIMGVLIVFMLYFTSMFKGRRVAFQFPVIVFLLVSVTIVGDMQNSYLSNPSAIFALTVIALAILFASRWKPNIILPTKALGKSFLRTMLFASPILLWILRSVALGGSFFGIGSVSISGLSEVSSEYNELMEKIFPTSLASSRFSPLSPLIFLLHPWANLYFAIVCGIIIGLLLFAIEARRTLFLLFTTFFFYLTITGALLSGRHLFLTLCFLLPAVGYGMVKLSTRLDKKLTYILSLFFCSTSILQYITLNLFLSMYPQGVGLDILNLFTIPYKSSYDISSLLITFSGQILVLNLILAGLVLLVIAERRIHFNRSLLISKDSVEKCRAEYSINSTNVRKVLLAALFGVIAASSILPYLTYATTITNGNLALFETKGSWFQDDLRIVDVVKSNTGQEDVVLTFSDVIASYSGLRVIDLANGGLIHFMSILDCDNVTRTANYLASMHIRFLLFPASNHYAFANFATLMNVTRFIRVLLNSPYVQLIAYGGIWDLYRLNYNG